MVKKYILSGLMAIICLSGFQVKAFGTKSTLAVAAMTGMTYIGLRNARRLANLETKYALPKADEHRQCTDAISFGKYLLSKVVVNKSQNNQSGENSLMIQSADSAKNEHAIDVASIVKEANISFERNNIQGNIESFIKTLEQDIVYLETCAPKSPHPSNAFWRRLIRHFVYFPQEEYNLLWLYKCRIYNPFHLRLVPHYEASEELLKKLTEYLNMIKLVQSVVQSALADSNNDLSTWMQESKPVDLKVTMIRT